MKYFFIGRNQLKVAVSSLAGTSMMTLYSYLLSLAKNKNFKEPELLGMMANRLLPWIHKKDSRAAGWGMHYLVGLLFAEAYAPFWSGTPGSKNIKTGLVLGGLSGIAAILIWKFALDAHPFPPAVHFWKFAGQLFIAHVVFGFFATLGYDFLNSPARTATNDTPEMKQLIL